MSQCLLWVLEHTLATSPNQWDHLSQSCFGAIPDVARAGERSSLRSTS